MVWRDSGWGKQAQYPAAALSGMQWRDVGPMRGGRSFAVAGVPSEPDTFYMGSVGGGVWKTETPAHVGSDRNDARLREFPLDPSAPLQWRLPTLTSSMSARASRTFAASTLMALAFSSRPMPARPGICGLADTRHISKLWLTRRIRIVSMSRRWVTFTTATPSGPVSLDRWREALEKSSVQRPIRWMWAR